MLNVLSTMLGFDSLCPILPQLCYCPQLVRYVYMDFSCSLFFFQTEIRQPKIWENLGNTLCTAVCAAWVCETLKYSLDEATFIDMIEMWFRAGGWNGRNCLKKFSPDWRARPRRLEKKIRKIKLLEGVGMKRKVGKWLRICGSNESVWWRLFVALPVM